MRSMLQIPFRDMAVHRRSACCSLEKHLSDLQKRTTCTRGMSFTLSIVTNAI